jgi:hypothetical protein
LLRVVLSNPPDLDVTADDFEDDRLRRAFLSIAPQLASLSAGSPVDPSLVADSELQSIVRSLAMDVRPIPEWPDMRHLVVLRRLESEIHGLETELAKLEEGSQTHTEKLRRLIALQQEKRSLG